MPKSIQHIAALYLVIIMAVKMLSVPVLCMDYALNKTWIAGTLCDNKDKPQLRCFGRCYLDKELAKAHETGTSQNQSANTFQAGIDFFETPCTFHCRPAAQEQPPAYALYHNYASAGFTSRIFHPPASC